MTKKSWNALSAKRSALRRVFTRSPIVTEILNEGRRTKPRYKQDGGRHKVDAVEFNCQVCDNWVSRKLMAVDHIVPVVGVEEGYIDLNTFDKRLFCGKENLQRICDPCHTKKSNIENARRREIKDLTALNDIELSLKSDNNPDIKKWKKELSKYLTSKKADSVKLIAKKLKENLLKGGK